MDLKKKKNEKKNVWTEKFLKTEFLFLGGGGGGRAFSNELVDGALL